MIRCYHPRCKKIGTVEYCIADIPSATVRLCEKHHAQINAQATVINGQKIRGTVERWRTFYRWLYEEFTEYR